MNNLIGNIDVFVRIAKQHPTVFLAALRYETAELTKFLQIEDFIRLIAKRGGRNIYIPTEKRVKRSALAREIGCDAVYALLKAKPPGNFEVPSAGGVYAALRPLVVQDLINQGLSVFSIAVLLGVHQRTIRRDLRKVAHKQPAKARVAS